MRGWKTEAKMSENFVSQWNYFKENTNLTSRKAAGKARQIRNFFLLKHEVFSVFWFIFNPFSVVNFTEGPQRGTAPICKSLLGKNLARKGGGYSLVDQFRKGDALPCLCIENIDDMRTKAYHFPFFRKSGHTWQ